MMFIVLYLLSFDSHIRHLHKCKISSFLCYNYDFFDCDNQQSWFLGILAYNVIGRTSCFLHVALLYLLLRLHLQHIHNGEIGCK